MTVSLFFRRRCSPLSLVLAVLLAAAGSSVDAILPTAELRVYQNNNNGRYTSMLASQASFGSYPSMDNTVEPKRTLVVPPSDNPLMCRRQDDDDDDEPSLLQVVKFAADSIVLIPRGDCTFERKAWVAQHVYGAAAIIIQGALASRYSFNQTQLNATGHSEATAQQPSDVVYPQSLYDYDCEKGRAEIETSQLDLTTHLPYNAQANNPVLQGNDSVCMKQMKSAPGKTCESKACFLTGTTIPAKGGGDDAAAEEEKQEACCAWDLLIWLYADESHYNATDVTIPAVYVSMAQGHELLLLLRNAAAAGSVVEVQVLARWRPTYNFSALLIWALGVFVAGLAAYLSAGDYHEYIAIVLKRRQEGRRNDDDDSESQRRPQLSQPPPVMVEPESMELTAAHAIGFILMASTSLLVLFYFKIYGLVKVMYAFGCSKAVSQVFLDPLVYRIMMNLPQRDRVVYKSVDFGNITVCNVISHAMGYTLGAIWLYMAFFVRHAESHLYFWVMQDVFGMAMCILFLQVIKLNSLKVAAILLTVAFFYDIFFVFISPLLFQGKSVMITVATSGGPPKADPAFCEKYPDHADCQGGEPLPMLFTIPRFGDYQGGSSLLGLGDIVLPGLLLSFAARLDAAKSLLGVLQGGQGGLSSTAAGCPNVVQRTSWCFGCCCSGYYLPPCIVAYGIGLSMANIAVYVMNMGQPALLYLVPMCLGTILGLGWHRGEHVDMWKGPKVIRAADDILYGPAVIEGGEENVHQVLPTTEEQDALGGAAAAPLVPSAVAESKTDFLDNA